MPSPETRVLMVTASEMVSDARICREAEALAEAGYRVKVLCLRSKEPARADGFVLLEIPHRWIPAPIRLAVVGLVLFVLTLLRSADVYHAHNVPAALGAWLAARLRRARLVYDAHELYAARVVDGSGQSLPNASTRSRVEAAVDAMVARRVDLHLTASERYAKEISATVGVPEPLVVPNYPPLASLDVEDCLRPALGVGDETIVLLYQGGFYLQTRALDVLIRAMPSLPPQYHLGLLGFGPHGEETQIHEWIREAGVIKRVTVVPAVPHQELPAWTIGADIGIIPFRLQRRAMQLGSPNKLYEYMGVGLPIVTTAAEEPVEILNATGAGRVYNADDPDDFVAQVGGLGNDRAQLRRMGNRNRRAAEDHYSWEKVSADLANAYGKMLKR